MRWLFVHCVLSAALLSVTVSRNQKRKRCRMNWRSVAIIGSILGVATSCMGESDHKANNAIPGEGGSVQTTQSELQGEGAAWDSAVKKGTVKAYLAFAREYPKSTRIQVRTGTVRGRYWYKIATPFAKAEKSESGVLVTVEGMQVLRNVSLKEAKRENLLDIRPATKGRKIAANGQTFNWTCLEVTSGGCVVNDELIAPKDSNGAMVVLNADGKSLLAWDLKNAKPAAQPVTKPTYIESPANEAWLPKP